MLAAIATLSLALPAVDAPQPPAHPLSIDPLGWAAHQSALCDCPEPLAKYLTYRLPMSTVSNPPANHQDGGREHLAIIQLINERWGTRYDLGAYDTTQLDFDYVDEWHAWVEQVQQMHGLTPVYSRIPGSPRKSGPTIPLRGSLPPVSTSIQLYCDRCAGADCDPHRLALSAQQAIHDGVYSEQCTSGCSNAKNEMRSRLIDMIWDAGPQSGGWTFKIRAGQAPTELQQVHGKITPIWGQEFSLDVDWLNISVPVLSWLHGYHVHILKPDGTWLKKTVDLNQPRPEIIPPYLPYPGCHPLNISSQIGDAIGDYYIGFIIGCGMNPPRPLP